MSRTKHCVAVLSLLAAGCGEPSSTAAAPSKWAVDGHLEGKVKDGERKGNVSGMACAPAANEARVCLVIDDEIQGAQVVVVKGTRLIPGTVIPLVTDMFGGKPVELDGEAATYADGEFYVIGSHGRPRNETPADEEENLDRLRVSSRLFRIRLGPVDLATAALGAGTAVTPAAALAPFFPEGELRRQAGKPLEDGGMTIEGFAVRGNTAIVGFRAPAEGAAALMLEVPLGSLFPPETPDGPGPAAVPANAAVGKLVRICLGADGRHDPRGIRDLAVVGSTIYGIAGPVKDPPKKADRSAGYAIFRLPESGSGGMRALADTDPKVKPEAIVPLDSTASKFEGLLLFDGPVDGAPRFESIDFSLDRAKSVSTDCGVARKAAAR